MLKMVGIEIDGGEGGIWKLLKTKEALFAWKAGRPANMTNGSTGG